MTSGAARVLCLVASILLVDSRIPKGHGADHGAIHGRCTVEPVPSEPSLYEKDSQEEYDANPDMFIRRNMTFGTHEARRLRLHRSWGVTDPLATPVYDKAINMRKLQDAPDFMQYGFTRVKLPMDLWTRMRDLYDVLDNGKSEDKIRPQRPMKERKIREHAKIAASEFLFKEQVMAGQDYKAYFKHLESNFGDSQDVRIANLMNSYAREPLQAPGGPKDILAAKIGPNRMKMWFYFPDRYCTMRSIRKWGAKGLKGFGAKGTSTAHSLGFWTNPGFWEWFRHDMFMYLHSRRYEIQPINYINWGVYARDFATGLIDFTNLWVPVLNYPCRPLVCADVRTMKQDSTTSDVRYPGTLHLEMGIHQMLYHCQYDPDTNWYWFDPKNWQDGHAVALDALMTTHASFPGVDTDFCDDPNTVRKGYDVRSITLNVDMTDLTDAISWLMDLNYQNLKPIFPTKEDASAYIKRHWKKVQAREE